MDRPHHISLRELLQSWNLHVKSIEPIKDVYKVRTDQGVKSLKGSPMSTAAMRFIHSALKHLHSQGFNRVLRAIPTSDGQDFIVAEGLIYSLYDWIDGRRPDFRKSHELQDAVKTMAAMHQAGLGFQPPTGASPRKRWGRLDESHKIHRQDLADFSDYAKAKRYLSRFDREFLKHLTDYLQLADQAIAALNVEEYSQIVQEAKQKGCICHGDVAERNFVLSPDGVMNLIDLDSCRLDLPVMDLVKLTRRVLKKVNWDPAVAKTIITAYQEAFPLSEAEIRIFGAVISFPQKFWRIADRYYHKKKFFSEEKAYNKLRKVTKQKKGFLGFLACYNKEAPDWWRSSP